jgi:hypothetical protein
MLTDTVISACILTIHCTWSKVRTRDVVGRGWIEIVEGRRTVMVAYVSSWNVEVEDGWKIRVLEIGWGRA